MVFSKVFCKSLVFHIRLRCGSLHNLSVKTSVDFLHHMSCSKWKIFQTVKSNDCEKSFEMQLQTSLHFDKSVMKSVSQGKYKYNAVSGKVNVGQLFFSVFLVY